MKNLLFIISLAFFIGTITLVCTRKNTSPFDIQITHPFQGALFPPEFPAPLFDWWSEIRDSSTYEIELYTKNKKFIIHTITDKTKWSPEESAWDSLKILSKNKKIFFRVRREGDKNFSSVSFSISKDTVGGQVLYRQMPIPFIIAEKKLDSMNFMLLDIGSKKKPHTAMKGFSVCGNCHSFTANGSEIGLDLDAGLRDKGGYFISRVQDTIEFNVSNYNSWSKMEERRTFGLFSKISPDGRYVVTTIKDRVMVKNFSFPPVENVHFSQLFFPVNGHLAVYDRQTKILKELPGANLPEYVQSNATWTPDGKYIIYCRAKALPYDSSDTDIVVRNEELIEQFVNREKSFKYDLYRVPFNNGEGGTAEPIKGASHNGKSNYFPAVSPDGKWLVYCQADNFMLLMPDSRLYIVPLEGGKARFLKCNMKSMNSWHAWSPDSRWLVFASKGLSPITDMFLTHIDNKGNASIPVLVDKARVPYKVINYPEFINIDPGVKFTMNYDFVELVHIERAYKRGDWDEARRLYFELIKQDLYFFSEDYRKLSEILENLGMPEEAQKYAILAENTDDSNIFKKR
jgi:hypothetical protein